MNKEEVHYADNARELWVRNPTIVSMVTFITATQPHQNRNNGWNAG